LIKAPGINLKEDGYLLENRLKVFLSQGKEESKMPDIEEEEKSMLSDDENEESSD